MIDSQQLSHHFHQLVIAFHKLKRDPASPKSQFHGRFRILKSLMQKGDVSQRELAELVAMKPGSLTEALENLERDHLVVRKRDANDRRIVRVSLTNSGALEEKKMADRFKQFEDRLLQPLTDEERIQLMTIVDKLTKQLEQMKEEQENG